MMFEKIITRILGEKAFFIIRDFYERSGPLQKKEEEKQLGFYREYIHALDLCFDVGANTGNRIGPLLQLGARVVAVEPQKNCLRFLRYKFGDRIELVTKGLCEKECIRTFRLSNASTISSFSDDWIAAVKNTRFKGFNWDRTMEVEMTTLDKLIEVYGIPVFIKIDVEGYELEVLKGLSIPVRLISFEYTVPERADRVVECIRSVEQHNPSVVCNYSVGENMKLELAQWMTIPEFLKQIQLKSFLNTLIGDIYLKGS